MRLRFDISEVDTDPRADVSMFGVAIVLLFVNSDGVWKGLEQTSGETCHP